MPGYGDFAQVYDLLTFNVPYDEIAEYYAEILSKSTNVGRVLDMGCGTGSLTARLAKMGFDMIGQDASCEMLSIAANKSGKVRWICQSMTDTDTGEQVDAVISTLDSINHLESRGEILRCFNRAAENLKPGGLFAFDVNTVFKHREILADNTFVYDIDGVYCVWQNTFDSRDNGVDIDLDIFIEEENGSYTRCEEHFREIALSECEICQLLEESGFEVVDIWDYLGFHSPNENSEKILILAKLR